ncbi:MAG: Fic family protein [Candidatus Diapherotrites archaeon]|nr:Fic family protein [Candidatus Diapherotrites archaeon]
MAYIEKKKISGREYFYLAKNVRISKGKWRKIRKYVGTDLSNLEQVEKELELIQPIKRLLTLRQMKIIELLRTNYLETQKIGKIQWKTGKDQVISFIYNTNAIEGVSVSFEDTKNIIEGKKTNEQYAKRDVKAVQNMKKCIDFLFEYKGDFNLGLLLKLHKIEMDGVRADAGRIRTGQNIVGNYLPPRPEQVPVELESFFSWFKEAEKMLHPFESAGLVHLKIARIHPFMDGNGRVSRLLMNHILFQNNYPLLNIYNSEKMLYYLVLREVDAKKKEKPFIKYLYQVYINQYKNYLLQNSNSH